MSKSKSRKGEESSSSGLLGLNDHHQNTVVQYMRFARYQRAQRLKGVTLNFRDLKDSRLTDDTFTVDEVTDMLDGLLTVVRDDVDSELIDTAHTNVLLLRQLFQQAEKWHLKLQADISELENRELLDKIKDFEEMEFAGAKKQDLGFSSRLEPINDSGGATLLNMEIQRLQDENDRLRQHLKQAESQMMSSANDRSLLKSDLDRTQSELSAARAKKGGNNTGEVDNLSKQMSGLRSELDETISMNRRREGEMEGNLASTKHELLRITEMLEMAEKELEKKVSQTAPFKNLKSMLQKKNDQLKELRHRLARYETLDD